MTRRDDTRGDDIVAHLPRLRRYAHALVRDSVVADDLVQDCVERALVKRHLFQAGTDMRAWLFTIMHNVHVDAIRKHGRAVVTVPLDIERDAPVTLPDQEDRARLGDLAAALQALPDEQRQAVLLVGIEGMSYKETAAVLDVPVGTVMSRLARGRDKLRTLVEGNGKPALRTIK